LFSLGVVLYRAATGRPPFKGADTVSTLMAVATHQPAPPDRVRPDVPAGLSDLVMHLLEKKPEERPGSAKEVARALAEVERDPRATATRPVTVRQAAGAEADEPRGATEVID